MGLYVPTNPCDRLHNQKRISNSPFFFFFVNPSFANKLKNCPCTIRTKLTRHKYILFIIILLLSLTFTLLVFYISIRPQIQDVCNDIGNKCEKFHSKSQSLIIILNEHRLRK